MHTPRLSGQVALVTGASSGIGRAAARALCAEGATVALVGRHRPVLESLANELRAAGGEASVFPADLMVAAEREALIGSVLGLHGQLDILVNAAGVISFGNVETTRLDDWAGMMELNLTAPFHLMQLALPALKQGPGVVVNVSSVTGLRSFPGILSYCTAKAGLDQLTRCAALELAPFGVRVNAVNPGVVVSGLHRTAGMDEARYAAFLEHSKTTHPLGRPGQPEEVADAILFLADRQSAWITGATLPIDGGRHLTCAR